MVKVQNRWVFKLEDISCCIFCHFLTSLQFLNRFFSKIKYILLSNVNKAGEKEKFSKVPLEK